ncbi:MAG: ABC transporter ATP-binding protein, partial [Moorea sp. SIO3C2]|nr:ABC transporter ATP-binding protein [Moorena sp. SIO3C2]
HVNININQGDIYGLIGPNGAGKTTLLRMLATAEEPTVGDIYIQGKRLVPDQPNPDIQRIIGFLPDDFPLYDDLTVSEYLDYFARLYYLEDPDVGDRINEVLALVSLANKRNSLISTLSRGMKQRLSLARTIIYRPKLLFLDEPVSGLDPIARVQYRETIKTLQKQGMTIVISSHILSDLEDFCTAIGVMELGRLVESSQLQALYQRERPHQQILISTLGQANDLAPQLNQHPEVDACELLPNASEQNQDGQIHRFCIQFTGTTAESAELLRSLIQSGHPITEFAPIQESLEDIFLELGYRQTS